MKKILLLMLILTTLTLGACDIDSIELADNIEAPQNKNLPIFGLWEIEDYKLNIKSKMDDEKAKSFTGMKIAFNNEFVSIGEDYCTNPNYKIRIVDAGEYLTYHYKVTPEFLNIDETQITIVSITGMEQFFYEFIRVSEDLVVLNMEGGFFYLKKIPEAMELKMESVKDDNENIVFDEAEITNDEALNTGILLGLKSLDLDSQNEGIEKWNYRTIFIRSLDKEIVAINEMQDILLPRKTGFWKVKIEREESEGIINDNIIAYPLYKTIDIEENKPKDSTIKNILYIGNDYISLENIQYRGKGERFLEFYPVDSIGKFKPLMIGDVLGEAGKKALMEGANKEVLKEKEEYKDSTIDLRPGEESFGLFRRNGHWIFSGRLNFVENGAYSYESFNINAIPPKEVVYYDDLLIPWNKVKSSIPDAIDVFTSPNEDMAIVVTHSSLLVCGLDNGNIGNKPLESIKLGPAEKVIMAEWAVGRYPKLWEKEFLK